MTCGIFKLALICKAYNLGMGKGLSVLELIKVFERATGTSVPVKIAERRVGDTEVVYCDVRRANLELDWEPKYDAFRMCKLASLLSTDYHPF